MLNKLLMLLLVFGLFSCGNDKDSSPSVSPQSPIDQYPSGDDEKPPSTTIPQKKDDIKLTVNFPFFSDHLSLLEKHKLQTTFNKLDEKKGHWVIEGYSFNTYLSLHRCRIVEHYLRHEMGYDVAGIVEGKVLDGEWGTVDITFTYYK